MDNPDPLQDYNIGLSHYSLGDLDNARRYYEAARQLLDPGSRSAAAFFRNYSICLGELGEYEQALNLVEEGLAYFPDYPDLYFIKGRLCSDLNLLPQAKAAFLKCTRFRRTPPKYGATKGVTGHLASENLAEVCAREPNLDEAVACLEQVLRIRPTYELFTRLCSLLRQKGLDGSEVALHMEGFHLDRVAVARLLFDMKDYGACLAYLDSERHTSTAGALPHEGRHGCELPEVWEAMLLKAKCLLRLGRHAEAVTLPAPCRPPSPHAADLLKQRCLGLWLQDPRRDAGALIAASGAPGHPAVTACREINSLLFSSGADEPDSIAACRLAPAGTGGPEPEAVAQILNLALEALLAGDCDLSLAASLAGCANRDMGEAYHALGRYALRAGYSREALEQLESALRHGKATADVHYLLGTACANLNNHGRAFLHFLQANRQEPENELYAACALEQLACQCLLHVTGMLALENGQAELRGVLFKLASLRKKAQWLREMGQGAGVDEP